MIMKKTLSATFAAIALAAPLVVSAPAEATTIPWRTTTFSTTSQCRVYYATKAGYRDYTDILTFRVLWTLNAAKTKVTPKAYVLTFKNPIVRDYTKIGWPKIRRYASLQRLGFSLDVDGAGSSVFFHDKDGLTDGGLTDDFGGAGPLARTLQNPDRVSVTMHAKAVQRFRVGLSQVTREQTVACRVGAWQPRDKA